MQEQEDDVQRAKSITSSNGRDQELHSSHLLSCSLIEGDSLYVVPRIQLLIDINIIIGFMNIFIKIKILIEKNFMPQGFLGFIK